ncbi:hypothetical protein LRY65_02745 [Candidatus Woesebacteria bacterium]|nr:hypothetical protein [Candidatus Woesebacteria bacterium]MCD8527110.1 hypothetical protein [Candidatus Woesebacteria bacterium]
MPARIPDTERQQILARLQSEITYDRLIDDPVVREIQQLSEDHWRKYRCNSMEKMRVRCTISFSEKETMILKMEWLFLF